MFWESALWSERVYATRTSLCFSRVQFPCSYLVADSHIGFRYNLQNWRTSLLLILWKICKKRRHVVVGTYVCLCSRRCVFKLQKGWTSQLTSWMYMCTSHTDSKSRSVSFKFPNSFMRHVAPTLQVVATIQRIWYCVVSVQLPFHKQLLSPNDCTIDIYLLLQVSAANCSLLPAATNVIYRLSNINGKLYMLFLNIQYH